MASSAGAKVGLCEMPYDPISSDRTGGLGGTCVIRGCVPKKLFVFGSGFSADFEDASGFGWVLSEPKLDWKKLLGAKLKETERLNGIYERLLDGSGVKSYVGAGRLLDNHTVEITGQEVREVFSLNVCMLKTNIGLKGTCDCERYPHRHRRKSLCARHPGCRTWYYVGRSPKLDRATEENGDSG